MTPRLKHSNTPAFGGAGIPQSVCPGALAGVTPINLCTAAGDHCLLHVHPVDKQFPDDSAITVGSDASKSDGLSDHHAAKMFTCSQAFFWLSPLPSQLGSVDTGKSDLLTVGGLAGVTVVAALNDDCLQGSNRLNQAKQQQQSCCADRIAAECHTPDRLLSFSKQFKYWIFWPQEQ